VPARYTEDPSLGNWVGKQRANKKKLDRGEPSEGMTAARAGQLDALGFAWAMSAAAISKQQSKGARGDAAWEVQLAKLKHYTREHGDSNVPKRWAEEPGLGTWVMHQRRGKKKMECGDPNPRITAARVAKLEALGFAWVRQ
jgi:hypothetical protein